MIRDIELSYRFVEAAEAHSADVGAALSSLAQTVRARRQRRVAMLAVATVVVAGLATAGWRALSAPRGPEKPAESPVRIILPPPGVATHLSVAGVETKVLHQIQSDAQRAGKTLVAPRIIAVTYLTPGQSVSMNGGSAVEDSPAWAIEFRGTSLACTSWCTLHPGGMTVFDDKTGSILASLLLDPVCRPFQLETPASYPAEVDHMKLPPCLPVSPPAHT